MAHFHSNALIGASGGQGEAFQIDRSLRFNSADSAYLNRTPSSAGNRKKWTWSGWVKRSELGRVQNIFRVVGALSDTTVFQIRFMANDAIGVVNYSYFPLISDAVFRDVSAWLHLVVVLDVDQASNSNKLRFYINGSEITSWATDNRGSLGTNAQGVNQASVAHTIGGPGSSEYFSGYLAEIHFVDGQALAPTEFGEEDSNGVWQPKQFTDHVLAEANGATSPTVIIGESSANIDSGNVLYLNSNPDSATYPVIYNSASGEAERYRTIKVKFHSAISSVTSIKFRGGGVSGGENYTLYVNGTQVGGTHTTNSQWTEDSHTITSTDVTEIKIIGAAGFALGQLKLNDSLVSGTPSYGTHAEGTNSFYLKFADNSSNAALGTDSSGNSNTWTVYNLIAGQYSPTATSTGDPTSSTDSPFSSGYSVDFDGNDSLRITGPGTITGDFTAECFIKSSSYGGIQRFFSADQASQSGERLNLRAYQGNTEFYVAPGVSASGTNLPTNQWNHVAITRSGSTVSYYLNGSRWATDTHSAAISVTTFVVAHGFGSEYFTGKVSNARFVDGQALYTGSSYTQPTATLTTTSQGAIADNVRLICCHQSSVTAAQGTLSAAADIDSLIDTPTNYEADSGNNGGNYATMNPLNYRTSTTYSNGNLQLASSAYYRSGVATIGMDSGKWYFEGQIITNSANGYSQIGITTRPEGQTYPGANAGEPGFGWYSANGQLYYSSSTQQTYSSWTVGDVVSVAYDSATRKCWIAKNGTWQNSGDPAAGTGSVYTIPGTLTPYFSIATGTNGVVVANFGQRPFYISSLPTGFKSLCTQNLADPTIADGSTAFDALLYTGDGTSSRNLTLPLAADFVWIKKRSATQSHQLADTVRGNNAVLLSNSTGREYNPQTEFVGGGISSISNTTVTLSQGTSNNDNTNANNATFVGWLWDAGTSTVSNTDGSITSNVRASQTNGFSIVTYTDPTSGNVQTVGHGLNAAPEFIIVKSRTGTTVWLTYHKSLGKDYYTRLDDTDASYNVSNIWGNAEPTSSVFGVKGDNQSNMVAYCWTSVNQFSSFGSYEGNGSSDGPFVHTGFRPAWVLYRNADAAAGWQIYDSARDPFNQCDARLQANSSGAEDTEAAIDILSNGFKQRATHTRSNASGNTYIYAAFAEHPFKTARAR